MINHKKRVSKKKLDAEWFKFRKWCEHHKFNVRVPGTDSYMDKNCRVVTLQDFGKLKLYNPTDIVDVDFEEVKDEENNGNQNPS